MRLLLKNAQVVAVGGGPDGKVGKEMDDVSTQHTLLFTYCCMLMLMLMLMLVFIAGTPPRHRSLCCRHTPS